MIKTLAAALLISSAFTCKIFSPPKCTPAPKPVPVKCPPVVPVKCPPVTPPIKCGTGQPGGNQPGDCTTVIDLPDLPRTPDQFCIGEPNYGVPIIRDPIINIPCAPGAPVIGNPGRPNIPVICDIKVPTVPGKPTLPSLPCDYDDSCGKGCWLPPKPSRC